MRTRYALVGVVDGRSTCQARSRGKLHQARNQGPKLEAVGQRHAGFDHGRSRRVHCSRKNSLIPSCRDTTKSVKPAAIANNSSYGLNGAEFSADLGARARRDRRDWERHRWLDGSPAKLSAQMGGVKGSGIGRENGHEGLSPYAGPSRLAFLQTLPGRQVSPSPSRWGNPARVPLGLNQLEGDAGISMHRRFSPVVEESVPGASARTKSTASATDSRFRTRCSTVAT